MLRPADFDATAHPPLVQPNALVAELARFLACNPESAERLLREHVDDGCGCCAGCGQHRRRPWPCVTAGLMQRVAEVDLCVGYMDEQ